MRPYLAIVKDSFREALHSWVLWIVIAMITFFLLAAATISYRQTLTVGLRENEVNWPKLVAQLEKAKNDQGNRGVVRIWSLLSTRVQGSLSQFKPLPLIPQGEDFKKFHDVVHPLLKELQSILEREDLYQSTSFTSAGLQAEGKELLQREKKLTKEERLRLNRLLLEASFGDAIEESEGTSLVLCFAGFEWTGPLPISRQTLITAVRGYLPFIIDKGLLGIGLFIAIVVTSPAIPNTFDPGSLHLLLSKPVSRSIMFLSKFFGSCAFVLLCATYLFIGLYFLLGTRWGVWEPRLMWCIPIYTFVFAVYYSVAALAALFWRNMIVSIVVAMLFWAMCFSVGLTKEFIEGSLNKSRIRKLVPADHDLLAVDCTNTPLAWNETERRWNVVLLSKELRNIQPAIAFVGQMPLRGPIYDQQTEQAVLVQISMKNGQQLVTAGKVGDNFSYHEGPASPANALLLLNEPDGQTLLATSQGLYRLQGDLGAEPGEVKFMGYKIPFTTRGGPLREAGPTPAPIWDSPFSATFAPDGTLFTFSRGRLQRFTKDKDGKYEPGPSEKFDSKSERRAWIAATKSTLFFSFRDGKLQLRDPQTLEVQSTIEPAPGQCPRVLAASPDGKQLAIIMENRKLWLLADGEKEPTLARVRGQGDLSAVHFTAKHNLLAVDRFQRVTEYDPSTWERKEAWAPKLDVQTMIYLYVLNPIYTICPKPGELYRTVTYLLNEQTDDKQVAEDPDSERNEFEPSRNTNPWRPVYSSFAFMCVMLAIGCIYMERQEF